MKQPLTIALLAAFVIGTHSADASPIAPKVSITGTNAVLRWASQHGENFVVLHRRAFHPLTPWQVLSANLPAATGAETTFTHAGGVPPVALMSGGSTGGGRRAAGACFN